MAYGLWPQVGGAVQDAAPELIKVYTHRCTARCRVWMLTPPGRRFAELSNMLRRKSALASLVADLGGPPACDTPNSMAVGTPSMSGMPAPSPSPAPPDR